MYLSVQVMGVLKPLRPSKSKIWKPPTLCPACACDLTFSQGSGNVVATCTNASCTGQSSRVLLHFVDTCVHGLGRRTMEALNDAKMVSNIADLYKLTEVC